MQEQNTQQQKVSLLTKDFILFWMANFLMALGFYFLLPTMPVYAMKVFGADKSQVGYIIGFYTLSAVAVRPFAGYALDSVGRKKVFLAALAVFALIIGSYYLAASFLFLLLLRLLHGFSWGVVTTGGGTIVADIVPPERRGEGLGYFGLSMTLAMALGPVLGLRVMGGGQYGRLFLSAMLLAAAAFLLAGRINYPRLPLTRRPVSWHAFFENRVIPIAVITYFTTLVYGGVVSFIILYSEEIGIKNGGVFFLAYAAAMSLVRPWAGRLLDRRGPGPVITAGFLSTITGFLLLSASRGMPGFVAAAVVIGAGNGMVWPTIQTMVINMVEPQRRGVANSTYFSALDLGIGTGSILLGWLANLTSIGTVYFVSGLLLIIPLVYFFVHVLKDYNEKLVRSEAHD